MEVLVKMAQDSWIVTLMLVVVFCLAVAFLVLGWVEWMSYRAKFRKIRERRMFLKVERKIQRRDAALRTSLDKMKAQADLHEQLRAVAGL